MRWLKGTMDHDGDGKPGGSRKGDGTMAKASTKSAQKPASARKAATRPEDTPEAKKTLPAKQKAAEDQFAKADAENADYIALRRANSGF